MNESSRRDVQGAGHGARSGRAYRIGVAVAVATSVLTVWTTIVRDDDTGIGYLMLVLAAAMGAFAAGLQPAGMARAMLGVAVMQLLHGIAIATAPVTALVPGAPLKALLFNAVFAAFWLVSAACFRSAVKAA